MQNALHAYIYTYVDSPMICLQHNTHTATLWLWRWCLDNIEVNVAHIQRGDSENYYGSANPNGLTLGRTRHAISCPRPSTHPLFDRANSDLAEDQGPAAQGLVQCCYRIRGAATALQGQLRYCGCRTSLHVSFMLKINGSGGCSLSWRSGRPIHAQVIPQHRAHPCQFKSLEDANFSRHKSIYYRDMEQNAHPHFCVSQDFE